jgi:DNA repair protein RecO (recombination protein O)
VLRVVDFGESDRVVALLTRDEGRTSALARAARRSRKRFGGALETGALLRVEYRHGRGDLVHLERAEVLDAHPGTLRSLGRVALASTVVELLRELCPELSADPGTFDVAVAALARIDREAPREELLLAFELHLLGRLGYAPVLEACVATGAPAPAGRSAYFDPARGGVVSRAAGGGPLVLGWPARRAMIAALEDPDPGVEAWDLESRLAVRRALEAFLSRHLGKKLRSAPFVVTVFGSGHDGIQEG